MFFELSLSCSAVMRQCAYYNYSKCIFMYDWVYLSSFVCLLSNVIHYVFFFWLTKNMNNKAPILLQGPCLCRTMFLGIDLNPRIGGSAIRLAFYTDDPQKTRILSSCSQFELDSVRLHDSIDVKRNYCK